MIKRMLAVLLTVVSLCAAAISEPMFAYTPFPLEGLADNYKNKDHGRHGYMPSTVYYNGAYHQFYGSNGQDSDNFAYTYDGINGWPTDHIRYRTSKDGVHWSAPRVVMHVKYPDVEMSACDPSVVYGDDEYWYMLYTGGESGYQSVVYLARSKYIQGPYFKYTDLGWEDEGGKFGKPKKMLSKETQEGLYGTGQQTVVKHDGYFWVWFRQSVTPVLSNEIRFAKVEHLTDLDTAKIHIVKYVDPRDSATKRVFSKPYDQVPYSMGDVRLIHYGNKPVFKMWVARGYLIDERILITRLTSEDGIVWTFDRNENESDCDKYGYKYIHNMGVSGDKYGWIEENGNYLISFGAPYLDGRDDSFDPKIALNRDSATLESEQYNITNHVKCDSTVTDCNLNGHWAMWQVLVDNDTNKPRIGVVSDSIDFPVTGLVFPPGVTGTNIDYFTGDYDGDGITDLGAVDRSTFRWYIRSTRTERYIANGEKMIEEMNSNFVVITGDYDGDGKTDIGAVDKVNGRWYIRSSAEGNRKGIGSSEYLPNWIEWGWQWGGMDSSYVVFSGDYDGDGIADRAIYSAPYWGILSSRSNDFSVLINVNGDSIPLGWRWDGMSKTDIVVPGDFDGDGITDRAIYNINSSQWTSYSSRLGNQKLTWHWKWMCNAGGPLYCEDGWGWHWGDSQRIENFAPCESCKGMLPVLGDFDGDGVDDLVQVNPSSGEWRFYGSLNPEENYEDDNFPDGLRDYWSWLKYSEEPVILTGDFDGDGKADRAFADKKKHKFYVISSKDQRNGISTTVNAFSGMPFLAKSASEKPIEEPKVAPVVPKAPSMDVSVSGQKVSVTNVESGSNVIVFNVLGKAIFSTVANGNSVNFELPSRGKFIVRAGSQSRSIMVK